MSPNRDRKETCEKSANYASSKHFTNRRYGSRFYTRSAIPISPYGWYRVLVFANISGCSIKQVLERLRDAVAPLKFRYYYLHEGGEHDVERDKLASFTFYVDNYKLAEELQLRGHKPPLFGIRVNDRPPLIQVNEAYMWKLRCVLASRYDANKRCLDLSRLHADEYWRGQFCALQQYECLKAIVDIMGREMPQLRRLLLDNNYLCYLGGFRGVEQRHRHLHSISLENNELKSLRPLRIFERLRITELRLKRNPLPRDYKSQLLSMFPDLRMLNGRPFPRERPPTPPPIMITISDSESCKDSGSDSDVEILSVEELKPLILPEPRVSYLPSQTISHPFRVRKFVGRYFKALDGNKRKKKIGKFYHENPMVSVILAKDKALLSSWSAPYAVYNTKLLASRQCVIDMYVAWPKTEHFAATMTLDMTLVQPKMIALSITGSFEENGTPTAVRYYMRSLLLTRRTELDEFRIANELIYLGRKGCRPRQPMLLDPEQSNLVSMLSKETCLKQRWSKRILNDTNWDYQQALLVFQARRRQRELPDTAFVEDIPPDLSTRRQSMRTVYPMCPQGN